MPPYESFTIPCAQTLLAERCAAGTLLQFSVRNADGRYLAQTLDAAGAPAAILVRGGDLVGPAGAPFGFFRRRPAPGSPLVTNAAPVAPDPVATIASVSAVDRAYECYHLVLHPLREPETYPLRDLYVARTSFEIVGLTYAQPFNATFATVHYRFAPAGAQHVWTLVHIDAQSGAERVDQDLRDIAFPADEPATDFTP